MAQERQVGKQEGRGEKEVQATKKKKKETKTIQRPDKRGYGV